MKHFGHGGFTFHYLFAYYTYTSSTEHEDFVVQQLTVEAAKNLLAPTVLPLDTEMEFLR